MYGITRTRIPGSDRPLFLSAYCCVCRGLSSFFGFLGRGLVGYDLAHLLVLGEAISLEPLPRKRGYCFLRTSNPLQIIDHTHPLPQFVSSLAMTAAYAWAADNIAEGGMGPKRLAAAIAGPVVRRRLAEAGEGVGLGPDFVDSVVKNQDRLEKIGVEEWKSAQNPAAEIFLALAAPTADFASVALGVLGRRAGVEDDRLIGDLESLGRLLGTLIYLWDACEDFDGDLAAGRFNPGILTSGMTGGGREGLRILLRTYASEAVAAFGNLPLRRHRGLLDRAVSRILKSKRHAWEPQMQTKGPGEAEEGSRHE